MAGSSHFTVMKNIFVTEFAEHLGETQLSPTLSVNEPLGTVCSSGSRITVKCIC